MSKKLLYLLLAFAAIGTLWFVQTNFQTETGTHQQLTTSLDNILEKASSERMDTDQEYGETKASRQSAANTLEDDSHSPDTALTQYQSNHYLKDYEEDWCIADLDLSEQDQMRAQLDKQEWLLQRGTAYMQTTGALFNDGLTNYEFLEPYQDASEQELLEFAKNDDELALLALLQNFNVSSQSKLNAANQLLMLGKTGVALEFLVMESVFNARANLGTSGELTNVSQQYINQAIVLTELGLRRMDSSGLRRLLILLKDTHESLNVNLTSAITEAHFDTIQNQTDALIQGIDEQRFERNQPALAELEIPHSAKQFLNEDIAKIHRLYTEELKQFSVMQMWQENYLQKNECIERINNYHN